MKLRNWRIVHRYLGLVIGVQLFLWTISGMVFSWNSIEAVRGENRIRSQPPVDLSDFELGDINPMIGSAKLADMDSLRPVSVALRTMLGQPVYEVTCRGDMAEQFLLLDAVSGARLSPINPKKEQKIAQAESQALQEVKSSAVDLAIAATGNILAAKLTGKTSDDYFAKSLAEVKSRLN